MYRRPEFTSCKIQQQKLHEMIDAWIPGQKNPSHLAAV
jgi:hypothetical protein